VLAGTSLNPNVGSSTRGVEWLRALLEPQGYTVLQVSLHEECLYLDIMLSLPREGVAIVCPEAFVEGIPSQLRDWDMVEVTPEQARSDACNGPPIDSSNYIVPWSDVDGGTTVQNGLEAHGITCRGIKYDHHHEDGGSIRCSTHPLVRRVA
jgi:N-dimethylarginine dimethylaminohydrolase